MVGGNKEDFDKAKNVIDSSEYQEVFKTKLQEDSKAAGRWAELHLSLSQKKTTKTSHVGPVVAPS